MEHIHLSVNLSHENTNIQQAAIGNTGIMIKINKSLLISKRESSFFNEEFYKYVIEIKVKNESWFVFRRYSEVRDEHDKMCKKFSNLRKIDFPPRGIFTKTDTFQIERQIKLEQYLKEYVLIVLGDNIYNFSTTHKSPTASSDQPMKLTKDTFCDMIPFFYETTEDKLNVQKLGWSRE